MATVIQVYTVRNQTGHKMGAFQAKSPKAAIARLIAEFAAQVTRSQPMPKGLDNLTAEVEPEVSFR